MKEKSKLQLPELYKKMSAARYTLFLKTAPTYKNGQTEEEN